MICTSYQRKWCLQCAAAPIRTSNQGAGPPGCDVNPVLIQGRIDGPSYGCSIHWCARAGQES
eukprot:1158009-Pelagomonas_calceolata.AAC.6